MASDPQPDKIFKALPQILKFSINVEKDTQVGRANLLTLLFVIVLTAALNAGPAMIDQVAQAIITYHSGGKELPEPQAFDYGLIWMWLLFMVVCMFFTTKSEIAVRDASNSSRFPDGDSGDLSEDD